MPWDGFARGWRVVAGSRGGYRWLYGFFLLETLRVGVKRSVHQRINSILPISHSSYCTKVYRMDYSFGVLYITPAAA